MDPAAPAFWLPLLEIIWIDILLSGDNAVPGKQINEQKHSLEINWRRRQAHRDCEFIGQELGSRPGTVLQEITRENANCVCGPV